MKALSRLASHAPGIRAVRLAGGIYAALCIALVTFGIFAGGAGSGQTVKEGSVK